MARLNQRLSYLESEYAKIYKILKSPATMRLKNRADPSWAALEDQLSDCGTTCIVTLNAKDFNFHGTTTVIDNILTLTVTDFKVKVAGDLSNSDDKKTLEYGTNPRGINFGFINLISVLMTSIDENLSRYPEIQKVRVVANYVINKKLAKTLKKMGFKPTKKGTDYLNRNQYIIGYKFLSHVTVLMVSALASTFSHLSPLVSVSAHGAVATAGLSAKPFTFKRRSWILELPVDPINDR